MNFAEASQLTSSEKITLVTIESAKASKIFVFSASTGPVGTYFLDVSYFVSGVTINDTKLVAGSAFDTLTYNQFFFDAPQKKLYFAFATAPSQADVIIFYKHFFSNKPLILASELTSGTIVEWLPYILSIGSIGQQLDDENKGIVLESSSSIDLINDQFFDNLYDTHIWENKKVTFYAWFNGTDISEAKKIFEGVIDSKDYSNTKVVFKVKDFIFKLRNIINLPLFTPFSLGIPDSLLGTPQRRIYGQVKQMQLAGVNNLLDGYIAEGVFSIANGSAILTGSIFSFLLYELSPGDEITFSFLGTEYKYGIESVDSDFQATLNKISEIEVYGVEIKVSPAIPFYYSNRVWNVAGHKLTEPSGLITSIISENRFLVDNYDAIFPGDRLIFLDGSTSVIRRLVGNEIVLETVPPTPLVNGTEFKKIAIQKLFFGNKELIYDRDWGDVITTESFVVIRRDAEFNVAQEKSLGVNVIFTNGSRTITTSSVVDLRTILRSRDFIKKNSIVSGEGEWYEILEVKEQTIVIRSPYSGTTATTSALIKNIDYIQDDSLITCDCLGMQDSSGKWIKTPSDAVKHLVTYDAGFTAINTASFSLAKDKCDYILSIVIPDKIGGKPPLIRDVITKINDSIFGSLYQDNDLNIAYSILNSDKDEAIEILQDDDIISYSVNSKSKIFNKISIEYRPFVDHNTGNDTFEVYSEESDFVNRNLGIVNTLERTLYLFEDDKAKIIAERLALFNSLSNTTVTIRSKMNLFLKTVNDKILMKFDRLFMRYGGADRRKVGMISGIKRSQTEVEIVVSDLGNVYNRVPSIASNTTPNYLSASQDDKITFGYIVHNDILTPDPSTEENLGNNIIG